MTYYIYETELVTIILHHYPERLECAICCNVPFIFSAAKALIWPWLPEKTRQKVLFLSDAAQREAVLTRYLSTVSVHSWPAF